MGDENYQLKDVIEKFKKETDEWLKPFGYSCGSTNGNFTQLNYLNYDKIGQNYPMIKVWLNYNAQRKVEIIGTTKPFIQISSGELQYKHPDINKYIEQIRIYEAICNSNFKWSEL